MQVIVPAKILLNTVPTESKQGLKMKLWVKLKWFLECFFTANSEKSKASQNNDNVVQAEYKGIPNEISDDDKETIYFNVDFLKCRSIDEILEETGLRFFHWKVFLLICLQHMADALGTSILSVILPSLKSDWNMSSIMAGVLTLSISIGMMAGLSFWGWVSDKYGRKCSLIGSTTFILVFSFVGAFSANYYWLWINLFFVGFGAAIINVGYVVIVEFFPPKHRTMFSVLTTIFWSVGFLFSAVVSMAISVIGYHWALATVCFPTAIVLIGLIFLPETPYYHLAAGDEQKALNILQNIAPEMDFSDTRLWKHNPETQRADFTQLFRSGYWKITICACIACFGTLVTYDGLIYTASAVASSKIFTSSRNGTHNRDKMYSIMTWMNLPEIVIVFITGLSCYVFRVKTLTLIIIVLAILSQIIALFVVNHGMPLLIVTMLSRGFLATNTCLMPLFASLVYPTENRGIGVGTCVCVGSIGTILGPFIFETFFAQKYCNGIVFNLVILSVTIVATVLLPSQSATLS
ncbi:synaptic vesicle 2-related protein-like [Dendronephthya gigantea]|uniref:synaptic vesicle 2-related protein-like n=1 Tax=Dendronephthya gigantea TaxID=151771 RepID=UPI00106ADD40|nr:synaptic vesicle 2-related protein-like [Dendronephthya gigantea]